MKQGVRVKRNKRERLGWADVSCFHQGMCQQWVARSKRVARGHIAESHTLCVCVCVCAQCLQTALMA